MKIALVFIAVCFIALSCAAPVEESHERDKRSSSRESNRRGQYIPFNTPNANFDMMNMLMPFLLARLFAPAPAPAPAAPAPPTGK